MDMKVKHINWMGNIYQKFEAVCLEVDDIVGQDAVKYLENRVQNVGYSMKKFYSGVVHELLPFPTLDSNAVDLANDQQAGAPIKHDHVNQVSDKSCSGSLEVEDSNQASDKTCSGSLEVVDSCITQEGVGDDSREASGTKRENLHSSIGEIAVKSTPKLMNLISVIEKEPLEFSTHSESYSGSSDSGSEVSVKTKDNIDVNEEQNSYLILEENAVNLSTSRVLNIKSVGEKESAEVSLFSKSSDVVNADKHDSSMVHACCEPSPYVTGKIMESQDGLVCSGSCQSLQSNDETPVSSIEFSLEDIQLNDDAKLEESCVFVSDSELYAVSCRTQKLRSYKERIQDAFASKKRLAKEYEQLAIWYGDTDMEPSQGLSRTIFPFSSRMCVDSKNLQVQHASETDWELL